MGIALSVTARKGLPNIMLGYRRRYGAAVGAVILLLILALSPLVLWDIRIIGGGDLDTDSLKETLRECGLYEGAPLWRLDTPDIETRVLVAREDIGWISINILGSVAEVEIVEYIPPAETEYSLSADITAGCDGVILWIEEARGYQVRSIGEAVKKGELIISGVYPADTESGLPERYTVAKGRVYARTAREYEVRVPLTYEKKAYTGREKSEKSIIFFNKEINFFKFCLKFFRKSGNLYSKYDTIETVEYATLPGGVLLPFGIRTVRYAEYETVSAERSEDSAAELARYILRGLEKRDIAEGSLLKKKRASDPVGRSIYSEFQRGIH